MSDNQLFAQRLKAARLRKAQKLGFRTARGYPQERLGIEAGIEEESASARINQYEQAKRLPDLGTAARLADTLDVPLSYLFCKDDDEARLLLAFHSLSSAKRKELLTVAESMSTQTSGN